jgi:AsmA protein
MPSRWVRNGLWALGALVVVLALAVAALPYFASTQIVRDRIAIEMSAWSGYRVELGDPPKIEVWPFRAILKNVTMSGWSDPDHEPVIVAERVEIELSALAALSGNVVFSTARLIRPTLRVAPVGQKLYLPVSPGGGRIARSIDIARAALAANPTKPDLDALPDTPFGKVEFNDGRITVRRDGKDQEIVSGIAGSVTWAALNRSGSLSATGIWRGENVALDVTVPKPLLLFAGGTAPLSVSLKAAPASLTFDGTATFAGKDPYFSGPATFSSPSLRRMMEWSTEGATPGPAIGSISFSGDIDGSRQRMKFDNANIKLDGNPGMGLIEVAFAGQVPVISGTLAFETLDLRSFLSAFAPLDPEDGAVGQIDTNFSDRLQLDLRLSAAKATAGSFALSDVAATAQVKPGFAAFDISDATAFGGSVQAGVRFNQNDDANLVEVRLLASDIDGALMASAAKLTSLAPAARGKVSVILKGPGKSWRQLLEQCDGSVTAHFGAGKIPNFNLSSFLDRMKKGGFFALAEVTKGDLPISGADFKATIAKGVARIDKAEARTQDYLIALSGIIPYVGGGLALSGLIRPNTQDADPAKPVHASNFFVGGSWDAPFVAPVFEGPPYGRAD